MLIDKEEEKAVDILRNCIEKINISTLSFNNSFLEHDGEYVGKILSDLARQGLLLRLSRGMYLKTKETRSGVAYSTTKDIARVIAEKDNAEILPTGSVALNVPGLFEQVTATLVLLTSGSVGKIKCGNRTVTFKGGMPKDFTLKGKITHLLAQAMKTIGGRNYSGERESAISVTLSKYPEDDIMSEDSRAMPAWIRGKIANILNNKNHEQLAESQYW